MQNVKDEFLKEIASDKSVGSIEEKIKEISYAITKKKIVRLKDEKKIESRATELSRTFIKLLQEASVENVSTISSVMDGVIKAATEEKENEIYHKISLIRKLEKEIEEEKYKLKIFIQNIYQDLEKLSDSLDDTSKNYLEKALNDRKLKDIVLFGILKETTEEALLTVVENKKDIEEITKRIIQNITYQAINEEDFSKKRVLNISKTILKIATSIADENQAVAKELLNGCVYGIKEAMVNTIIKFNENLEFLPDEIRDVKEEQILYEGINIIDINEDYLDILHECAEQSNGISRSVLKDISLDINSSLSKIFKITSATKENILKKIDMLKESPKVLEIKQKLTRKISDLNLDETLKKVKKENFDGITKESKKLGLRAWEVAKSALDNAVKSTKENLNKKDDQDRQSD